MFGLRHLSSRELREFKKRNASFALFAGKILLELSTDLNRPLDDVQERPPVVHDRVAVA